MASTRVPLSRHHELVPGLFASVSTSTVLRFSCPDVNVNDSDFLELGFFVEMGSDGFWAGP